MFHNSLKNSKIPWHCSKTKLPDFLQSGNPECVVFTMWNSDNWYAPATCSAD